MQFRPSAPAQAMLQFSLIILVHMLFIDTIECSLASFALSFILRFACAPHANGFASPLPKFSNSLHKLASYLSTRKRL